MSLSFLRRAAVTMAMSRPRVLSLTVAAFALILIDCAATTPPRVGTTAQESAGPWTNLLDGSAGAWRGYRSDTLPAGWQFDAGTGVLTRSAGGGDIVTRAEFGDFELELEWRVGARGNSGVFYRATEGTERIYENAPEMQVLDNAGHADGRNPLTSAGSNYALHAPNADVTRPPGEWNVARVVAAGAHVEHWLNGTKIVSYELWSPEWKALVQGSKFRQWPSYGLATRGRIGLQDHGDVVSFRHIRIREIAR